MRSSDLFYGLLAAMAAFTAVVMAGAGMGAAAVAVSLLIGVIAVVVMFANARSAPQVLVVGRRDGRRLDRLESELDAGGFAVATCAGPDSRLCPVLVGRPCPIPAHPSATVAYLEDGSGTPPPCERYFHVPTVTVGGGEVSDRGAAARGLRWDDGTRPVLDAVRELTRT